MYVTPRRRETAGERGGDRGPGERRLSVGARAAPPYVRRSLTGLLVPIIIGPMRPAYPPRAGLLAAQSSVRQ